jgi:hypothetical protein
LKKYIGILLFFTLASPYFISYTWFSSSKHVARNDAKRAVTKGVTGNNMVCLTFSLKDAAEKLRWEKKDEFEYGGQMFDICKTQVNGDTVSYWCYWDKKETSLNAQIKNLLSKALGQGPQSQENQKRLQTFLQSLFLQDHFKWNPSVPEIHNGLRTGRLFSCMKATPEPSIPPPRKS